MPPKSECVGRETTSSLSGWLIVGAVDCLALAEVEEPCQEVRQVDGLPTSQLTDLRPTAEAIG